MGTLPVPFFPGKVGLGAQPAGFFNGLLVPVSCRAGDIPTGCFELVSAGGELPAMPPFLMPERYVYVPLAETYDEAGQGVPAQWKRIVEGLTDGNTA